MLARRRGLGIGVGVLVAAGLLSSHAQVHAQVHAQAAGKTVVLPFDLILQKKEEDFFIGASKPSPAEQQRLAAVYEELKTILKARGTYDLVDPAPIAKEIEAAAPIYDCNGCEIDLAKKLDGAIVYTSVVDKASETLLNMRITEIDVASGKLLRAGSVVIQGNTDEAWMRAVRWIMKNRFAEDKAAQ